MLLTDNEGPQPHPQPILRQQPFSHLSVSDSLRAQAHEMEAPETAVKLDRTPEFTLQTWPGNP